MYKENTLLQLNKIIKNKKEKEFVLYCELSDIFKSLCKHQRLQKQGEYTC
jgi:hypothetical protein